MCCTGCCCFFKDRRTGPTWSAGGPERTWGSTEHSSARCPTAAFSRRRCRGSRGPSGQHVRAEGVALPPVIHARLWGAGTGAGASAAQWASPVRLCPGLELPQASGLLRTTLDPSQIPPRWVTYGLCSTQDLRQARLPPTTRAQRSQLGQRSCDSSSGEHTDPLPPPRPHSSLLFRPQV